MRHVMINIPIWDTMLHTLNGFLCAGVGISLVNLLNENVDSFNLSPIFVVLVSFCFSMTVGVCWEFIEYGIDKTLRFDMQKDTLVKNISTIYLDDTKTNKVINIDNIGYTIIYDDTNNVLARVDGGYLDIGINDTMKDLLVNFLGALVFDFMGYFYLKNRKGKNILDNFIIKSRKSSV